MPRPLEGIEGQGSPALLRRGSGLPAARRQRGAARHRLRGEGRLAPRGETRLGGLCPRHRRPGHPDRRLRRARRLLRSADAAAARGEPRGGRRHASGRCDRRLSRPPAPRRGRGVLRHAVVARRAPLADRLLRALQAEHLPLRPEGRSLPQLPQLAPSLPGGAGRTDPRTGRCVPPQPRRFRVGDPPGSGHPVERVRLPETRRQVQQHVRPRRAVVCDLLRRHLGRGYQPAETDRAAEPPDEGVRRGEGRRGAADGLPDRLFASVGEPHAAGEPGHLRTDARPLGEGLLDGRRGLQRHDPRDDGVGQLAHPASGLFLVELPRDGLRAPHHPPGPRLRTRHHAHRTGGVRHRQQPDGARRSVEAGPVRRGGLCVEHRLVQRPGQLGARPSGACFRGSGSLPHLRHPLGRHRERLPARRVVGDADVPPRRLVVGSRRGPARGVRTCGAGSCDP